MIGPLWLWGVYRQWRCEKMLTEVFGGHCDTFSARVWALITLRLFPHLRLIGVADWDLYWQSVLPRQIRDPVGMIFQDTCVSGVGPEFKNGDPEALVDLANQSVCG
jgi:hypothetical protein